MVGVRAAQRLYPSLPQPSRVGHQPNSLHMFGVWSAFYFLRIGREAFPKMQWRTLLRECLLQHRSGYLDPARLLHIINTSFPSSGLNISLGFTTSQPTRRPGREEDRQQVGAPLPWSAIPLPGLHLDHQRDRHVHDELDGSTLGDQAWNEDGKAVGMFNLRL